uniref:Glycosyltransferase 61 catalytic domain-containing protein n=1 Tax=Pseudictyota dubia TaxID=2749911 RepID=A0A7R9VTR6_9STRA
MILKTREQLNLEYHPHRVTILWRDSDKRRREPIRDADGLKQSLEEAGYLHVDIVHSSNSTLWSCIDCQLDIFRNTWLFIASHGAGIMNLQFMAANTSVVEIASADRPEEPIYSNLEQRARLLGQHFYHYYWHDEKEKTELNATAFVEELVEFSPPIAQPRSYHQVPQKVF